MTDIAALAAEILRLDEAATPGDWWQGHVEKYHVFSPSNFAPPAGRVVLRANEHFPYEADMALVAAARNAAPRLARVLAAIVPELERLRDAHLHTFSRARIDTAVGDLLAAYDRAKEEP